MSLWLYVVIGLLVVIAIIVLMKADSRPMRRFKKSELITNVTYICMHCGNTFKGSTCPKCGSNNKQAQFGK